MASKKRKQQRKRQLRRQQNRIEKQAKDRHALETQYLREENRPMGKQASTDKHHLYRYPKLDELKTVGVKHVPLPTPRNAYAGKVKRGGSTSASLNEAQAKAFEAFTGAMEQSGGNEGVEIALGTPQGLYETGQALSDKVAHNKKGLVYDFETLGVMPSQQINDTKGYPMHHAAQLSVFIAGGQADGGDVNAVLVNRLDDSGASHLSGILDKLETDPRSWASLDDNTKRTVADMALYQNPAHFARQQIGEQTYAVMTGQSHAPDYKKPVMVKSEHIASYRKGLANLTNPELTNSTEQVVEAFNFYASRDDVTLIGQNNQRFDQPVLKQLAESVDTPAARQLRQAAAKPEVDVLTMARHLMNEDGVDVENFQLSSLYNHVSKQTGVGADRDLHAHFAGDDGWMTHVVADYFEKEFKNGKIDFGQDHTIHPGDRFHVKKGTGHYYESNFNRNRGQHDMTLRYDPESNEWTPNYTFKEPSVSTNQTLEFERDLGWVDIDGHKHRGMMFEDTALGTHKVIFRENMNEFVDLFDKHIVPEDQKDPAGVRASSNDAIRRRYEELFQVTPKHSGDTIGSRLDKAHRTIDTYDQAMEEAYQEIKPKWDDVLTSETFKDLDLSKLDDQLKADQIRHEIDAELKPLALNKTMAKLNAGKDFKDPYHFSKKKVSEYVEMKDQLEAERPIYDAIRKELPHVQGVGEGGGDDVNTRISNEFFATARKGVLDKIGPTQMEYPTAPRTMMVPSRSNKGEMTLFSFSDMDRIEGLVRQTVKVDETRGKGSALESMENLLRSLGPAVDEKTQMDIRTRIKRDLNKEGKPSAGTVKYIAKHMHKATNDLPESHPAFIKSVPGFNPHSARFDGTFSPEKFQNELQSNKQEWFKEIIDDAADQSVANLHTSAVSDMQKFDIVGLSDPARQRVKRAQDVTDMLEKDVVASKKLMGLYGNQPSQIVSHVDHEARIEQTITQFQEKGYNVVVDHEENSGNLFLYFAHKDDNVQPANMSSRERLYSGKLNPVVMPLTTKDASIPIGGGEYMKQGYAAKKADGPVGWKLKSTTESYYDLIGDMPKRIEDELKKHEKEGHPISRQQATENVMRRNRRKMRDGGISAKFFNADADEKGLTASSRQKNMAAHADMTEYLEDWMKTNMPEEYEKFETFRQQDGNEHKNITEGLWDQMDTFKTLARVRQGAMDDWNKTVFKETGVQLNPYGLNEKQWGAGMMALNDPRQVSLFGEHNPGSREQVLKVSNYRLMDADPLDEFYMSRYGGDERQYARAFEGIIDPRMAEVDAVAGTEDGHKKIIGRNLFTNDQELNESLKTLRGGITQEISQLESQKKTKTGSQRDMIDQRLESLRLDLEQIDSGKLSVFEEQSLMRESLMDSIRLTDELKIDLDRNKTLDDRMQRVLEQELKEAGIDLNAEKTGRVLFNKPLTVDDMKARKIVDEDNVLTVGKLKINEMEGEVDRGAPKQTKRLYSQSLLEGVEYTEDGMRLILKQQRTLKDGDKVIEAVGGTRNTVKGIRDSLLDRYIEQEGLHKHTDFITEHIKDSRHPRGGVFGALVETSYYNAMDDFDRAFDGGDAQLDLVKNWVTDRGGIGGAYEDERKAFAEEVFMEEMKKAGIGDFLQVDDSGRIQEVKPIDGGTALVGQEGYETYSKLFDKATNLFGFDERQSIKEVSVHNTSPYQRAGHSVKMALREQQMLQQTFTDLRDPDNLTFGADTPLMQHINKLTTPADDNPHIAYGQTMRKALKSFAGDGHLTDAEQAGNVILDLTGKYDFAAGETVKKIGEGDDAFFAVDAFKIQMAPQSGERDQISLEGTSADVMGFMLSSDDAALNDVTVGDLVKESNGQAFLAIQDPDNPLYKGKVFSRDVVPVIPSFEDSSFSYDTQYQREASKAFERMFNQTRRFTDLDFSKGSLKDDPEGQLAVMNEVANLTNRQMKGMEAGAANYLIGSGAGSYLKGMRTLTGDDAASGVSSMKNIFTENERTMDEVYVSKDYAMKLMDGKEANILAANNLSIDDFESVEDARQEILSHITGARGDDEFEMLTLANRFPTQSEGSLVFANLRVDEAMDGQDERQMAISRGMAKLLGADNDGDTIYLNSYFYRSAQEGDIDGSQPTNWQALQGQMSQLTQSFRQRGESLIDEAAKEMPGNTFQKIRQLTEEDRIGLFQNFTDEGAAYQQGLSNTMKAPGIGMMDNTLVAARQMMNWTMDIGVKEGAYSGLEHTEMMEKWDNVNNMMVQNFISAKKIDTATLAGGAFNDMEPQDKAAFILNYGDAQNDLPGMIKNLDSQQGVDNLVSQMYRIDMIGKPGSSDWDLAHEENDIRDVFGTVATHNKVMKESGVDGGMHNIAFNLFRSTGQPGKAKDFIQIAENEPSKMAGIATANTMMHDLYADSPEVIERYNTAQAQLQSTIGQNLKQRLSGGGSFIKEAMPQDQSEQIDIMNTLVKQSVNEKQALAQERIGGQLKTFGKKMVQSDGFAAGVGMAAMWMVASAVKRGPTPEGNEAQQTGMATPEEIDPSRLLSGPTARVTPNAERVMLRVNGTGNADQDMIAGVVNRSVSEMTGMPMQMHMDLTDNTQKLDKKFYQQTVSNALDLNL